MRPLVQHGFRTFANARMILPSTSVTSCRASVLANTSIEPTRWRAFAVCSTVRIGIDERKRSSKYDSSRGFGTSARCREAPSKKTEEQKREEDEVMRKLGLKFPAEEAKQEDISEEQSERKQEDTSKISSQEPIVLPPPTPSEVASKLPRESLPSHRESKRSELIKKMHVLMEEWQEKLAVIGQQVNTYTGTDYSGIQQLRQEIAAQEKIVKDKRQAILDTKHALESAQSKQESSRQEVVGLLERKHSWSPADLERYMTLVRSEHLNQKAVQDAKDNVFAAEQALEEARGHLEKRERLQYHEEQIWSDTIRRNSTWITFGLMGFNIFLLLASLAIIEPWRRRRLVKEIRSALEEHTPSGPAVTAVAVDPVEAEIDAVVEPTNVVLGDNAPVAVPEKAPAEKVTAAVPSKAPEAIAAAADGGLPIAPQEVAVAQDAAIAAPQPDIAPDVPTKAESKPPSSTPKGYAQEAQAFVDDLFSDRSVTLPQKAITAVALEGFAAGTATAAIVWLAMIFLKPR